MILKKIIFKTNEWLNKLAGIWSGLFYLSLLIFPCIIISLLINNADYGFLIGIIWAVIVYTWRMSYIIMKGVQNAKENNKKKFNKDNDGYIN